jgi:hypothetical protein
LIAALLTSRVLSAEKPAAAAGIALQTLAGLLAAIQLWANSASDKLVGWAARQIAANRWHFARLFDGSPRSLFLAAGWYVLGVIAVRLPVAGLGWLIAIPASLILISGALVYVLVMFMVVGSLFVGKEPPPDGKALTALRDRIDANDWVWPLIGAAFLIGGALQIAVAGGRFSVFSGRRLRPHATSGLLWTGWGAGSTLSSGVVATPEYPAAPNVSSFLIPSPKRRFDPADVDGFPARFREEGSEER